MTRTVADAAALLSVIAGRDEDDPITNTAPERVKDYTLFLDEQGLRGARIGVDRKSIGKNPPVKALFEAHLEAIQAAGATLIDITFPEEIGKLGEDRLNVLLYEFKADLNKYLVARRSPYKSLEELIQFNEENKEREMPLFGQEIFLQAQAKSDLSDPAYIESLRKVRSAAREDGIDAILAQEHVDAIVARTGDSTWSIAATAGYPYITVPAGFFEGLPVGMGFFAGAFSEGLLIKLAYAFEQLTKARRKPEYLPGSG